jgi:hypothetical protein
MPPRKSLSSRLIIKNFPSVTLSFHSSMMHGFESQFGIHSSRTELSDHEDSDSEISSISNKVVKSEKRGKVNAEEKVKAESKAKQAKLKGEVESEPEGVEDGNDDDDDDDDDDDEIGPDVLVPCTFGDRHLLTHLQICCGENPVSCRGR